MNALSEFFQALLAYTLIYALGIYEGTRESWHKWRLGDRYEGPLEG